VRGRRVRAELEVGADTGETVNVGVAASTVKTAQEMYSWKRGSAIGQISCSSLRIRRRFPAVSVADAVRVESGDTIKSGPLCAEVLAARLTLGALPGGDSTLARYPSHHLSE